MKTYNIRYLLWKEWQELFLRNLRFNAFNALFLTLILNFLLYPIFNEFVQTITPQRDLLLRILLNYTLTLLPFMIILIIGSSFLREAFYKEKIKGTFENLLATPVSIQEIWLCKGIMISLLSYSMFLLITIFTLSIQLLLNNFSFSFFNLASSPSFFNFFIASPLLAFSILGILGYLEFFLKQTGLIIFFIIFPLFYFIKVFKKIFEINWKTSFYIVILAIVLLCFTYTLLRYLKKEKVIANF